MPFGDYTDYADCTSKNSDKADPEAFCAELQRRIEGKQAPGWISREQMWRLCPTCAERMQQRGLKALNLAQLDDVPLGLARALAKDPGFMTRCLEDAEMCAGASDKAACCMALQEKLGKMLDEAAKPFTVAKLDEDQRLVFGYASVAKVNDGSDLVDLQGDQIAPDDLEKAAYDFVLEARIANEMHQGEPVGQLVESVVITPEKLAAMGLRAGPGAPAVGLWLGFKLTPDAFAKVKRGDYTMFSIEGTADEELVNA